MADLAQIQREELWLSGMKRIVLVVTLQLIAFWAVWQWYGSRAIFSWDQPWGLLAFVAAFVVLFVSKKPLPKELPSLLVPSLLIALYAATYFVLPALAKATIAFTAFALTLTSLRFGKLFHPGVLGLFYLSLPTIPSLQFVGGYPLRVLVAQVTAPILRLGGFAVVPEGTCLNWAGKLIWIDGPCSGIKMLWVGMFLTLVLICLYELPVVKAILLMPVAFVVIIGGNVFRAVSLFYLEAGVLDLPSWGHDYAGVIAFVLQAVAIIAIVSRLRKGTVCAAAVSST
ncbi:MAG TPA: archaeosortase/exosortase family protein [Pyrinomonadaceae bacterium]|nr:archaeosortase/exosortase family protein [Pyrinomonadaceae bacterium]